jgi:hypothetical protein
MSSQQLSVSFGCTPSRVTSTLYGGQTPTEAVVETVSELSGISPERLPPLDQWIDPTMVNQVFEQEATERESTAALCFTYAEWNVFVRSDGTIVVGNPEKSTGPTPLL